MDANNISPALKDKILNDERFKYKLISEDGSNLLLNPGSKEIMPTLRDLLP